LLPNAWADEWATQKSIGVVVKTEKLLSRGEYQSTAAFVPDTGLENIMSSNRARLCSVCVSGNVESMVLDAVSATMEGRG
jgi:hypothetical protein